MDRQLSSQNLPRFQRYYSAESFWKKIQRLVKRAGAKTVYYALVLYYTLKDRATPYRYKAVIAGALGYLILPADMVPDLLPFAGLADDWAALTAAVMYVLTAITPEIKEKAKQQLENWFGPVSQEDIRI
ncbi:MAG: DUF1232 domain-containing protein [Bacteroidales bacterium]|nr:DUF1232 domain-containing protein [Bacteroidales bacterium]